MLERSNAGELATGGTKLRVLITGASGFVGSHLARACALSGDEVVGLSRSGTVAVGDGHAVDLRESAAVTDAVRAARPDIVYHLAALSSVGRSWEDPADTVEVNTATAVNVLEAIRHEAPAARVVWVSSCEVYGVPHQLPIDERAAIAPENPYAVSKTAADMLAGVYRRGYGLQIVRARSFNHAGPGQRDTFILSSLARQAAEARLSGASTIKIVTGNPDARRDFTDVRDVVRAYRLLATDAESDIYNVCSGRSVSAGDQLELLRELLAPLAIEHVVDPARVRAHEVMDLRGSHERLTAATGWQPEIPLRQTMADTIEWWQTELTAARALR
jgi:GDP-4-dehydro-6-deoxy-D-mannose reductase